MQKKYNCSFGALTYSYDDNPCHNLINLLDIMLENKKYDNLEDFVNKFYQKTNHIVNLYRVPFMNKIVIFSPPGQASIEFTAS